MRPFCFLLLVCLTAIACNKNRTLPDANARFLWASPAGEGSSLPNLFSGPGGTVFFSWVEKNKEGYNLMFSQVRETGWSAPTTIAHSDNWFINWADHPIISSDSKGKILVHIPEKSGDGKFDYIVRVYTSLDSGRTWQNTYQVNEDRRGEHGFISSQPYKASILTAWLDGRHAIMDDHPGHGGRMTLRAALFDPVGLKEREWELDSLTCDCCQTAMARTDEGIVVFYRDRTPDEVRDISVVRFADSTWSTPQAVSNDGWKINGCPVNGPRAASIGNTVALAWYTAPGNDDRVNFSYSRDGGRSFSPPVRIDGGDTGGRVDVACMDNEHFVVSWMEGNLLMIRLVTADGRMGIPIQITKSTTDRSSGFPQMEVSGEGVVLAWTDTNSGRIKTGFVGFTALLNSLTE